MSTTKSRILILVLLVTVVAMLTDLSSAPRSKFTAANYDRLVTGMTMDEVIAILGEPDSVDHSMQGMAFTTWYSPFDADAAVVCTFVYPNETLMSKGRSGDLPNRALLLPEELPKREMPSFLVKMATRRQENERRATLMLDVSQAPSPGPILP